MRGWKNARMRNAKCDTKQQFGNKSQGLNYLQQQQRIKGELMAASTMDPYQIYTHTGVDNTGIDNRVCVCMRV